MSDVPALQLRRMINGYQVSQAIYVAATLGVADLLAGRPQTSDELAEASDAHPDSLYRLLRALAAAGVVREEVGRSFSLTPLGELLRTDVDGSLAGWAAFVGRPYHWESWANLLHSVQTGENAFHHLHGRDVWEFREEHPEEGAIFDRAMTSVTGGMTEALLESYDFGRFGTVVDVGGGNGVLLAALLQKHSQMQGVLFDDPAVVSGAEELLREMGVVERCELVGGSFFEAVPAGVDAYILKSVIHDWEDEDSVRILRVCRDAMRANATLLVLEWDLGPPNAVTGPKFSDLNMLVAPGGRERTVDEYRALFEAAGFTLEGVIPDATGRLVLEGKPA